MPRIKKPKRTFMGLPVEEANAPLYVQPNDKDIHGATKGDPENCMYARCIKRCYGSAHCVIFKEIAYVQLVNEKGQRVYRRFELSAKMRRNRLRFDLGEKIKVHGLILNPPAPERRLDARIKDYKARIAAGYKKPPRDREGIRRRIAPTNGTLYSRDGSGMVKFLQHNEDAKKVKTRAHGK